MSGMDLQSFVSESISQICQGIADAQRHVRKLGAMVSPRSMLDDKGLPVLMPKENALSRPFLLKFDLALTVETVNDSSNNGAKKAAIKVAAASFGFEHSNGTTLNKTDTQSVISHVAF